MIYDHSLVHGWRSRIEKEELAARDTLRKFMGQRTDPSGATGLLGNTLTNNLQYNVSTKSYLASASPWLPSEQERNGPWGNGGNFSEAKFDQVPNCHHVDAPSFMSLQPFTDLQDKRVKENIRVWDKGAILAPGTVSYLVQHCMGLSRF